MGLFQWTESRGDSQYQVLNPCALGGQRIGWGMRSGKGFVLCISSAFQKEKPSHIVLEALNEDDEYTLYNGRSVWIPEQKCVLQYVPRQEIMKSERQGIRPVLMSKLFLPVHVQIWVQDEEVPTLIHIPERGNECELPVQISYEIKEKGLFTKITELTIDQPGGYEKWPGEMVSIVFRGQRFSCPVPQKAMGTKIELCRKMDEVVGLKAVEDYKHLIQLIKRN